MLRSLTCDLDVETVFPNSFETKNKPKTNQAAKLQLGPEFQQCRQANYPSWGQLLHLKCDFENLWNTFRIVCPKPTALALYKVFSSSCRKSDMEVSPPWQIVFLTRRRWQTEWPNLLTRQHLRFVRVSFPALHPRAKHPSFSCTATHDQERPNEVIL